MEWGKCNRKPTYETKKNYDGQKYKDYKPVEVVEIDGSWDLSPCHITLDSRPELQLGNIVGEIEVSDTTKWINDQDLQYFGKV